MIVVRRFCPTHPACKYIFPTQLSLKMAFHLTAGFAGVNAYSPPLGFVHVSLWVSFYRCPHQRRRRALVWAQRRRAARPRGPRHAAHVLALEADSGKVWSWGRGDEGQLGHGNTAPSSRPRAIACFGGSSSSSSKGDETLSPGDYRSSSSSSGHGGGSGVVRAVAIACGRQHSCALDDQGQLWTWGGGEDGALGHG
jgi:hypothetical protein